MKTKTLIWINLLGFLLLIALAMLLLLALVPEFQSQVVSINWHDLASVGWVTNPL
jgi:hypothetical protein